MKIVAWFLLLVCFAVIADANEPLPNSVIIPAGEFQAGRPDAPITKTTDAFWMHRTEVTQKQFRRTMGWNRSFFLGPTRPVDNVKWYEADEYCRKIGMRLPTEWEWEKAARAGSTTQFYWGDAMDDRYAWHKGNSEKQTHPVGKKLPNAYGLYDMSGNVWEWTASDHEVSGKVVRGGSWRNSGISLSSGHRILSLPIHKFHYVGFRCALTLENE